MSLPSQAGRVAVVTGASGGIGLWTAQGLAQAGAEVMLVGRSRERLAAAAAQIGRAAGRRPRTELADFASLRAVRDLADRLAMRLDRLDILVNNAGLMSRRRLLSADGYERTFAVNHLAPFLLTTRLLGALRAAAAARAAPAARVVNVASIAHMRGRIAWDDLMATHGYKAMAAYAQSKLANILFTTELARRLAGTSVTANALHPGLVGSGFGDVGGIVGFGWGLVRPFLMSPQRGAETSLYVATAPALDGVSGRYFASSRQATPAASARDAGAAARLWTESEALVARALVARALA